LAMVDEADAEHPDAASAGTPGHMTGAPGLTVVASAGQDGASAARSNAVGDLRLGTVVVDVQDMQRAVSFWSAALGYESREVHVDAAVTMLVDPDGHGLPISLQAADARPTEPVRLHLDFYTRDPGGQVARLLELGAQEVRDWPYPRDAGFIVLRDPDGNEFCVVGEAPA